jgi:hypothetical protein
LVSFFNFNFYETKLSWRICVNDLIVQIIYLQIANTLVMSITPQFLTCIFLVDINFVIITSTNYLLEIFTSRYSSYSTTTFEFRNSLILFPVLHKAFTTKANRNNFGVIWQNESHFPDIIRVVFQSLKRVSCPPIPNYYALIRRARGQELPILGEVYTI